MILVTYCRVPETLPASVTNKWLDDLPADKRRKTAASLDRGNGKATLIGLRLLLESIRMLGDDTFELRQIGFAGGQKPVIDGNRDFNISHSGNLAVCAVSLTGDVGIDIEKVRPVRVTQLANRIAEPAEAAGINTLEDFFDLWTKKEAVAKAAGATVAVLRHIRLDNGRAEFEGDRWFLRQLDVAAGYVAYLAHDHDRTPVRLQKIDLTG